MKAKIPKIIGAIIAVIVVIFITTSITKCAVTADDRKQEKTEAQRAQQEAIQLAMEERQKAIQLATEEYKIKKENVKIIDYDWRTVRLSDGAIFSLTNIFSRHKYRLNTDVVFENSNDFEIKDFRIEFKFYGNSGTLIETYTTDTIYESIPAHGEVKVGDIDIGYSKVGTGKASMEFILPTDYYSPIIR